MNLPQFTAGLALYRTHRVYREGGVWPGTHGFDELDAVVPSNGKSHGNHPSCIRGMTWCDQGSGGGCFDLSADPQNCGACGQACSSGYDCCGGQCWPVEYACCGGNRCGYQNVCCADNSCCDPAQDGVCCGNTCCQTADNSTGARCFSLLRHRDGVYSNDSFCLQDCMAGFTQCGSACVNLDDDPQNCSACGKSCPPITLKGPWTSGEPPQLDCLTGICFCPNNGYSLSNTTNYFLSSGCDVPVQELNVTLTAGDDLYSPNGFGMQLNAMAMPGNPNSIVWMQYIFGVNGQQVFAEINYWTAAQLNNANSSGTLTAPTIPGLTLPTANTIPAGYTLEIDLTNDSQGNVNGAYFTVTDTGGNTYPSGNVLNSNSSFANLPTPIQGFDVLVVGKPSLEIANLSGFGTITYEATSGLCVLGGGTNPCSGGTIVGTGERSNAVYLPLAPPCCDSSFTQIFLGN